jgi:hypothetical protein
LAPCAGILTGRGREASVSVYRWEGSSSRPWTKSGLKERLEEERMGGLLAGSEPENAPDIRESLAMAELDWRGRSGGSPFEEERVLCVLSKAAAAREERKPLEDRFKGALVVVVVGLAAGGETRCRWEALERLEDEEPGGGGD